MINDLWNKVKVTVPPEFINKRRLLPIMSFKDKLAEEMELYVERLANYQRIASLTSNEFANRLSERLNPIANNYDIDTEMAIVKSCTRLLLTGCDPEEVYDMCCHFESRSMLIGLHRITVKRTLSLVSLEEALGEGVIYMAMSREAFDIFVDALRTICRAYDIDLIKTSDCNDRVVFELIGFAIKRPRRNLSIRCLYRKL